MIDPTKVDMNQLQKKFIDGALGGHARDFFSFVLTSGNNIDSSFATTPQVMKSIAIWINTQVQTYEKTFGEIDMTLPKINSPIQMADLKKPGDNK